MRHLILTISLIFSFTLGLATAAQAGFFNNRVDWNQIPQNVKEGYAVGLYDGFTIPADHDSQIMQRWKDDLSECSQKVGFTIPTIVDLIDTHYLDTSNWKDSPVVAMVEPMSKACAD